MNANSKGCLNFRGPFIWVNCSECCSSNPWTVLSITLCSKTSGAIIDNKSLQTLFSSYKCIANLDTDIENQQDCKRKRKLKHKRNSCNVNCMSRATKRFQFEVFLPVHDFIIASIILFVICTFVYIKCYEVWMLVAGHFLTRSISLVWTYFIENQMVGNKF